MRLQRGLHMAGEVIIPEKLQSGDEVRIIAPSKSLNIISENNIEMAIKRIESLGLKVSFSKNIKQEEILGCASIEDRVADLHDAFSDKNVKAILTVIGGYNVNQILSYLDYDLIRSNPKILCGFSDITSLQNAIFKKTNLVVYSGLHFSSFAMQKGFDYCMDYFKKIFFQSEKVLLSPATDYSDDKWYLNQDDREFIKNNGYWVINPGIANGSIICGNLGTLQLLHGTEFCPSFENNILFLEEVSLTNGECDIHEFDRDLQSVIHQPGFDGVKAIVFGRFERFFNMNRKILTYICNKEKLKNMPIIANVDFGHTMPIVTFPIGGHCALDAKNDSNVTIHFSG
jgi:muramoyltetrapeptide carboxypeptidase